jgi:hypothetical protein
MCPWSLRCLRDTAEETGDTVKPRQIDTRFQAGSRSASMTVSLDGVAISDHSIHHRKVVLDPASPHHCLRRREFCTVIERGLPHPKPGAESRHVVLFDKFVNFMSIVVVL